MTSTGCKRYARPRRSIGKAKTGKTQNNDLDVESNIIKRGYTRKWSKTCEGRL